MGAFDVVPGQPINEFQIGGRNIVSQKRAIEHDEVLGDRSVEPLNEWIHLGAPGIRVEVNDTFLTKGDIEVCGCNSR